MHAKLISPLYSLLLARKIHMSFFQSQKYQFRLHKKIVAFLKTSHSQNGLYLSLKRVKSCLPFNLLESGI